MNSQKGQQDPLGAVLGEIINFIVKIVKNIFKGVQKLKYKNFIIGFTVSVVFSVLMYFLKGYVLPLLPGQRLVKRVSFAAMVFSPFWYLIAIGSAVDRRAQEYYELFSTIGFKGKDGKYPHIVDLKEEEKKTIYTFQSNIPLVEWQKSIDKLETALNCKIVAVVQGKDKRTVVVSAYASDLKIPTMLEWNNDFIHEKDGVLVLGEDITKKVYLDLNSTPHAIVAGETGSGKSVILRALLWQMVYKNCKVFMTDFKGGVEFGLKYEHFGEVYTRREEVLPMLEMLVKECETRLQLFREYEVKNLKEYNQKMGENLCRVGVFIDELAEMLDKSGLSSEQKQLCEKIEGALSTLARLARAPGIHLFIGIQRPDANVLTGQIKNNIPARISGRFADKAASEIVLGNTAAVNLPEVKGRFLIKNGNDLTEFQSYYFNDDIDLDLDIDYHPGSLISSKGRMEPQREVIRAGKTPTYQNTHTSLNLNFDD